MNYPRDVFLGPERAISPTGASISIQLHEELNVLCRLIANVTESYSAAIFVKGEQPNTLAVAGVHTLSREFVSNCIIPYGSGLIGWTAENGLRIAVSPFEHDATTLLCYSTDQQLKSFVALPILDKNSQVLGVISCDSKKSYAFAKLTEKILQDCAIQARTLIELHVQLEQERRDAPPDLEHLLAFAETLRACENEDELLKTAAHLPESLLDRDALVVMSLSYGGVGKGKFYSAQNQGTNQHRLLELVCNHQKILCADRSVHALPTNSTENRSFLSIPFHVLDREAGSLNILSRPFGFFEPGQITLLEKIALVVGQELERLRLKDRAASAPDITGILSWKHFAIRANLLLAESRAGNQPLTLVRVAVNNLAEVEDFTGIDIATHLMQRVIRLIDQIKGQGGVACYLYGSHVLFLTNSGQADRIIGRLQTLISKIDIADFTTTKPLVSARLGDLLLKGTKITYADFPAAGDTLSELAAHTLRMSDIRELEAPRHAGNWA